MRLPEASRFPVAFLLFLVFAMVDPPDLNSSTADIEHFRYQIKARRGEEKRLESDSLEADEVFLQVARGRNVVEIFRER